MSQTLSEAKWLVPLAFGYDLVRDGMPGGEERERLRSRRFCVRPRRLSKRYHAGKSNWQSWHNAALLAVGLLLTVDRDLIHLAVDGLRADSISNCARASHPTAHGSKGRGATISSRYSAVADRRDDPACMPRRISHP